MTTALLVAVIVSVLYVYGILLSILANVPVRRHPRQGMACYGQELTRIREFQYN
jgi:hypothetical protein|nr:MAG: hypothetical protein KatS3mg041_1226 [Bacteroidota bacterium]